MEKINCVTVFFGCWVLIQFFIIILILILVLFRMIGFWFDGRHFVLKTILLTHTHICALQNLLFQNGG